MKCRHCSAQLQHTFIDLGSAPPSNAYLTSVTLHAPEKWYPLKVLVCEQCWLVQTEDFTNADELFDSEYAYFSGFSTSWLEHSGRYVNEMSERFNLGPQSHVVEVAANDGYLLQYVVARGIPCTGVEPTASTATVARSKGIPVIEEFFGLALAREMVAQNKSADLTVANNVLAHVPDINDFVAGFAHLLKPLGVSTFEFPHLLKLVEQNQFDTIYHEHFSYLSLSAVVKIFERNGLSVFDAEELSTHGGSLRVFAQRVDTGPRPLTARVEQLLHKEEALGMRTTDFYSQFGLKANAVKDGILSFLIQARREGKRVVAYGAAAKGNTLMNYAGIRGDLVEFVVDRNPAKQGKFMPGSRIPIVGEHMLSATKPEYIIILPWNLQAEISAQLDYARGWGAQFVTAVPSLAIA